MRDPRLEKINHTVLLGRGGASTGSRTSEVLQLLEGRPGAGVGLVPCRPIFGEQAGGFALHRPFHWCLGASDGSRLSPAGSGGSSRCYRGGWEGCGISLSFLEFLFLQVQLNIIATAKAKTCILLICIYVTFLPNCNKSGVEGESEELNLFYSFSFTIQIVQDRTY